MRLCTADVHCSSPPPVRVRLTGLAVPIRCAPSRLARRTVHLVRGPPQVRPQCDSDSLVSQGTSDVHGVARLPELLARGTVHIGFYCPRPPPEGVQPVFFFPAVHVVAWNPDSVQRETENIGCAAPASAPRPGTLHGFTQPIRYTSFGAEMQADLGWCPSDVHCTHPPPEGVPAQAWHISRGAHPMRTTSPDTDGQSHWVRPKTRAQGECIQRGSHVSRPRDGSHTMCSQSESVEARQRVSVRRTCTARVRLHWESRLWLAAFLVVHMR